MTEDESRQKFLNLVDAKITQGFRFNFAIPRIYPPSLEKEKHLSFRHPSNATVGALRRLIIKDNVSILLTGFYKPPPIGHPLEPQ